MLTPRAWVNIDGPLVAVHICAILREHQCENAHIHCEPEKVWESIFARQACGVSFRFSSELSSEQKSFDAVVSLDQICNVQPAQRAAYQQRITSAARKLVITSAPLGTDLQRMIFKNLVAQYLEKNGHEPAFLADSLRSGLPVPDEIFGWVQPHDDVELFYSGDVAAFQAQAERLIHNVGWQRLFKSRLQSAHQTPIAVPRELSQLETVPMRRHRRFYLVCKRK